MTEIAAIIGGTGIYALPEMDLKTEVVKTPFGDVKLGLFENLVFINRHAPEHSVPPHRVNYRANIKALDILGVKRVCATFAVGSINRDFELSVPVILDDFIDFSSGREHTFFDTLDQANGHVDVSKPFCSTLSDALESEANKIGMKIRRGGVYASTNGPRFESPAEIKAYRSMGADVVGMTLCPELPLALELGMSYSGLAFSINWGAGMESEIELVHEGVDRIKSEMLQTMMKALSSTKNSECKAAPIL